MTGHVDAVSRGDLEGVGCLGGQDHSVGADRSEDAVRAALLWAFLKKEIGGR